MGKGSTYVGSYNSIRISRERSTFCVTVTDPEIEKKNSARSGCDSLTPWIDPNVKYDFADKASVLKFLDKAMDIALPEDTYTSTFDKLAKEAGASDE